MIAKIKDKQKTADNSGNNYAMNIIQRGMTGVTTVSTGSLVLPELNKATVPKIKKPN